MIIQAQNTDQRPSKSVIPGPVEKAAAAAKVLIVEDELELAEILEFNLHRLGIKTVTAHGGLSACRLIRSERPDLILLDIMLPDLSGWEICRMVRTHPDRELARIPIIMLTALGAEENRIRGVELDADAYITKPYALKEVLLQTRRLIEQRRQQQQREQALSSLQEDKQRQNEWQQMLFHELKNQLVVISGYSRRLTEKQKTLSEETSFAYAQAINRGSDYLSNLADEFMLIRQIEDGQKNIPLKNLSPRQVLENVIGLFRTYADYQNTELRTVLRETPEMMLNATALKLVFSSLMENAFKYNGAGGQVVVELTPRGKGFEVQVKDTGPGIAESELELVFSKFYRSPKAKSNFAGSGLGLYTALTLVKTLGGEIDARNRPGGGACFSVRF